MAFEWESPIKWMPEDGLSIRDAPPAFQNTKYFITKRFTHEKVINVYCIEKSRSLVNKAISQHQLKLGH